MPMVKVVTYVDVGPWHVKGEKRRFLKSKNSDVRPEVGRGQKCLRICPIASAGPASSCKRMSFRRLYQM